MAIDIRAAALGNWLQLYRAQETNNTTVFTLGTGPRLEGLFCRVYVYFFKND